MRGGYDVVAYWNGFGTGDDKDQRRLLRRVANEWLRPDGIAILDAFNPTWWARLSSEPKFHDECKAWQQTRFDPAFSRFVDAWWPDDGSEAAIEQSIRCYSPVDLTLLLEGTGLRIESLEISELESAYSYLVVLKKA